MGYLVGLLMVCSPRVVVRSVLFINKDDLSVTTQLYPETFFQTQHLILLHHCS